MNGRYVRSKTFVVANYSVSDCLPRPVSCRATSYDCLLVEACGRSGSSSGTWGAMLKLRWRVAYGGLEDSLEEEAEGNASPHTATWVSHFNLLPRSSGYELLRRWHSWPRGGNQRGFAAAQESTTVGSNSLITSGFVNHEINDQNLRCCFSRSAKLIHGFHRLGERD